MAFGANKLFILLADSNFSSSTVFERAATPSDETKVQIFMERSRAEKALTAFSQQNPNVPCHLLETSLLAIAKATPPTISTVNTKGEVVPQ